MRRMSKWSARGLMLELGYRDLRSIILLGIIRAILDNRQHSIISLNVITACIVL